MNKLYIIGDINVELFAAFTKELTKLESAIQGSGSKEVLVELCSHGGDPNAAMAIAGRIRVSGCNIRIRAYGEVQSSAIMVLAAGHKREMVRETWAMVHETFDKVRGTTTSIERQIAQSRRDEEQWCHLLYTYTGTGVKVWSKLHKDETYLNAEQCLKLRLIDKVI